jgi:tetratricopeptide (TPR) repeat protein
MPLTQDLARLIGEAGSLEDAGERGRAEALYLEVIDKLEPGDEEIVGAIWINLGSNAVDDGRPKDAIDFYSQAIEHLDDRKGEAMLQTAHAQYNLARVYLRAGSPKALPHAESALELYQRYPFTQPVDLVDAQTLQVVARADAGRSVTAEDVDAVWEAMKQVSYGDVNQKLAFDFLSMLLAIERHAGPQDFHRIVSELATWANPELAAELSALVERGSAPT